MEFYIFLAFVIVLWVLAFFIKPNDPEDYPCDYDDEDYFKFHKRK